MLAADFDGPLVEVDAGAGERRTCLEALDASGEVTGMHEFGERGQQRTFYRRRSGVQVQSSARWRGDCRGCAVVSAANADGSSSRTGIAAMVQEPTVHRIAVACRAAVYSGVWASASATSLRANSRICLAQQWPGKDRPARLRPVAARFPPEGLPRGRRRLQRLDRRHGTDHRPRTGTISEHQGHFQNRQHPLGAGLRPAARQLLAQGPDAIPTRPRRASRTPQATMARARKIEAIPSVTKSRTLRGASRPTIRIRRSACAGRGRTANSSATVGQHPGSILDLDIRLE